MAIDFGIHGLDYTRDICCAIERYTESAVRRNSKAFIYRGMQLRYAVERWLYIQCINSQVLFIHYINRSNDASAHALPELSALESDIAFFLCHQRAIDEHPRRPLGRWLLATARFMYGWLRHRRPRPQITQMHVKQYDILINVVNAKFANYLEPVTRMLASSSFAYLVTSDVGLAEKISQRRVPVVSVPTENYTCKHIFCFNNLFDYMPLMDDADAILAAMDKLQPKCVLVVEGNAPMDVITAEACRLVGIPCFCVQQGWSPYVNNGFRNMKYTEMFVWGERFAELLRPYNSGQVFSVTGNHALKSVASKATDSINVLSFFLQAPCALMGVKAYEDFIDLIVNVAKAHPRVRVIVREHPGYPVPDELRLKLQCFLNVHFSFPTIEPLADLLAASDLVISVYSTVLLEALAMDVVPLICSIGAMRRYTPDIASAGAAIEVQSVADARCAIDEVIADPARLVRMREGIARTSAEFFSPKNAAMIIAARLSTACKKRSARELRNEF